MGRDVLFFVRPRTDQLYSGMLLQPNLDIRSKTRGQAFILEFPLNQFAKKTEFCKLFLSRTTGGLIPFLPNQPKDH